MLKETNIDDIRNISRLLFDAVCVDFNNIIVQHPYISCVVSIDSNNNMINLSDKKSFKIFRTELFNRFNKCNLYEIYYLVNSPWKLTWLKFTKPYLNKQNFSELLANAWVTQENPNMDVNVSRRTAISWFKHADKKILMTEEDYNTWIILPDKVTIYRGVSIGRTELGLSWTSNKQKACWFQHRFDCCGKKKNEVGYLLKATIDKKHILAYLNTRGEDELVIDVYAIKDKIIKIK